MLDARIPLMAQGLNLEPRSNALMRAAQLQGVEQANALRAMQMEQIKAQAAQALQERQAQEAAARARDEALAQAMGGNVNPIAMMRAGVPQKDIEFVANAGNLGRSKVSKWVDIAGTGGQPMVQAVDEFGAPVGQPMPKAVALKFINTGTAQVPVNEYTGQKAGSGLAVGMSPSERDASARGWANVNLARDRLAMDRAQNAGAAKPPTGYRFKADGTLEAIPGGPADIKAGEAGAKAAKAKEAALAQSESVLGAIKEARDLVGITTAGPGGMLASVPGMKARDLQSKLTTIKANLGFDRLQQMRDMSPTGGALGQVAVQELVALQSTIASLDQLQSPDELRAALDKIETHYTNWKNTLQGGQPAQTGAYSDPDKERRYQEWKALQGGAK